MLNLLLLLSFATNDAPISAPTKEIGVNTQIFVKDLHRLTNDELLTLAKYANVPAGETPGDLPNYFEVFKNYQNERPFDAAIEFSASEFKHGTLHKELPEKLKDLYKNPDRIQWTGNQDGTKQFTINTSTEGRIHQDVYYTDHEDYTFVCNTKKPVGSWRVVQVLLSSYEDSFLTKNPQVHKIVYGSR